MEEGSCHERSYDYAYANPVQVTKFFNLDLVLFIHLFGYLFIFSNVHSLFQRKLTLGT